MRIVVSTCNTHLHLIPIFTYLFNKYWGEDEVILLGYDEPEDLPDNFTFVQMNDGDQGKKQDFSNHLFSYFSSIDDTHIIWSFEDTFFKSPVKHTVIDILKSYLSFDEIGRIDLTEGMSTRSNKLFDTNNGLKILSNHTDVNYKISTQMSIWNRQYLLDYLKPDRTPWTFETQGSTEAKRDNRLILGVNRPNAPVDKNEGVTKQNLHKFNLKGMDKETIHYIRSLTNDRN